MTVVYVLRNIMLLNVKLNLVILELYRLLDANIGEVVPRVGCVGSPGQGQDAIYDQYENVETLLLLLIPHKTDIVGERQTFGIALSLPCTAWNSQWRSWPGPNQ